MNEQNDLIQRLGSLQQTLNRMCVKQQTETKEKTANSSINKRKIIKKRIPANEETNSELDRQFRNYLLEQKLIGTIDEIMLTRNFTKWRKQLGRKILIRAANAEQQKPTQNKNKKNKPKKQKNDGKKKTTKKETSNEYSNDELIKYASDLLEKRKRDNANYANNEGVEAQLDRFNPEHDDLINLPDEESALQSDDLHQIKNPFIIKNSINFSDSDDEFLHTNENGVVVRQSEEETNEENTLFSPSSEEGEKKEEKVIEQKSNRADLDKATNRALENKQIINKTRASLLSMNNSVVFDINDSPNRRFAMNRKEDIVNIPPSDAFSRLSQRMQNDFSSLPPPSSFSTPATLGTDASTTSSSNMNTDSTCKLIRRAKKAIDTKPSSDRFDSLVSRAQALLHESNDPIDDIIDAPLYVPEEIPSANSSAPIDNDTPNSVESSYISEKQLNSRKSDDNEELVSTPQTTKSTASIEEKKMQESSSQTEIQHYSKSSPSTSVNSSPSSKAQIEEEDEEIADFERRLTELTSSSKTLTLDDEGEVIDIDDYLKSMGLKLNGPQYLKASESDDDFDLKDDELDHELAALRRTFNNTLSNMPSSIIDSDDDFEARLSQFTLQ